MKSEKKLGTAQCSNLRDFYVLPETRAKQKKYFNCHFSMIAVSKRMLNLESEEILWFYIWVPKISFYYRNRERYWNTNSFCATITYWVNIIIALCMCCIMILFTFEESKLKLIIGSHRPCKLLRSKV